MLNPGQDRNHTLSNRRGEVSFAGETALTYTFWSVGVWLGRHITLWYQGNNSTLKLKRLILLEGLVSLFILLESLENNFWLCSSVIKREADPSWKKTRNAVLQDLFSPANSDLKCCVTCIFKKLQTYSFTEKGARVCINFLQHEWRKTPHHIPLSYKEWIETERVAEKLGSGNAQTCHTLSVGKAAGPPQQVSVIPPVQEWKLNAELWIGYEDIWESSKGRTARGRC